ncbi:MAG TPA: peptide chain release factor N(5)-glutamine methyltransferase [Nitrospirales bacterium]|nr:peptide chain release factor N(5)-glutamine methyltransferase [Nitrospirales bacterium]
MLSTTLSVGALRRQARDVLQAAAIADPAREADWLLASALGLPLHTLIFEGGRAVTPLQTERAWALIRRRAAREPLQYLLGTQEFYSLEMAVTPDVLIPRPETELLVEATLQAVMDIEGPRVLDVGTGSGCIAVSLARERSDAAVIALDISAPALAVAQANAIRHGVCDHIKFVQADLLGAFSFSPDGVFDVIVSNPPYIRACELSALQPEVAWYEPRVALAAGTDGLDYHRWLLNGAPELLKGGGHLVLELGCGQADQVRRLSQQTGAFISLECRKDAAGIERVLVARVGAGGAPRVPVAPPNATGDGPPPAIKGT